MTPELLLHTHGAVMPSTSISSVLIRLSDTSGTTLHAISLLAKFLLSLPLSESPISIGLL